MYEKGYLLLHSYMMLTHEILHKNEFWVILDYIIYISFCLDPMQLSQAMYVTLGMPHIGNPSVSQIEIWSGGHITYLRITSSSHHSIIVTSLHHYHTKPKDSVININIWQATWGPCEWRDMFGSKRSQEAKKSKEQGVMIKKNSLEKKLPKLYLSNDIHSDLNAQPGHQDYI